jgi:hypothetical protein
MVRLLTWNSGSNPDCNWLLAKWRLADTVGLDTKEQGDQWQYMTIGTQEA